MSLQAATHKQMHQLAYTHKHTQTTPLHHWSLCSSHYMHIEQSKRQPEHRGGDDIGVVCVSEMQESYVEK
jgi:hypothetical protein